MRLRVSSASIVLCAALCGATARLLSPAVVAEAQGQPVFAARSELVVVNVLVKDRKGAYVIGLTRDAFTVDEDGVRQTIQFFAEHGAPATVGLLIDSSGSMADAEARVITAAGAFVETSNPGDEIFALAFNDRVRPALPSTARFTGDASALREALTRAFRPRGPTALYDAITAGFEYLTHGTHHRTALVVVSDGGDNASKATLDQVVKMTEASNTVIYTIGLIDRNDRVANPRILEQLAETSGGEAFRPRNPGQVERVLRLLAHDIRNTYTFGYVSTNTARDYRLRRIHVAVQKPGERDLRVRARSGYVAEPR